MQAKVRSIGDGGKLGRASVAKLEVINPRTNSKPNVVGVQALDEAVEKISALDRQFVKSAYLLGQALLDCHNQELWRLRRHSDGSQKYGSWAKFAAAELTISRKYAYSLMQIGSSFTRSQIEDPRLGTRKLMLLMRVKDDSERTRLLAEARDSTVATVKAKVDKVVPPIRGTTTVNPKTLEAWSATVEGISPGGLCIEIAGQKLKIPLSVAQIERYVKLLGKNIRLTVGVAS